MHVTRTSEGGEREKNAKVIKRIAPTYGARKFGLPYKN